MVLTSGGQVLLRLSVTAGAAIAACNAAFADCLPNPPPSGGTVSCTGPAPTTTPVIAQGATGVTLNINADAQLLASQSIIALGTGARINNFGSIQVTADAVSGVLALADTQVRNFGAMSTSGANALGFVSVGDNTVLSNEVGGEIRVAGNLSAGLLTSETRNNVLSNAGHIVLDTFQGGGLFAQASTNALVVNTGTGLIETSQDQAFGMAYVGGSAGTVLNQGTIVTTGQSSHGVLLNATTGSTAINSGSITTSGGASEVLNRAFGIFLAEGSGNTALNLAGGTINASGLGSSAMEVLDSANNTLRNEGTLNVSGAGAHGIYVVSGNANTLDNRGTVNITGARGNGLRADDGNTSFLNSGTILVGGADAFGVYMQGSGNTLTNSGTIRATGTNADGVVSNTVSGTFTSVIENTSTGQIISDRRYAVRGVNGQETLINSGLISSGAGTAIDLRAGNDTLILRTGSQIVGLADGGAGTDLVMLQGTGQASNDFQNFETLSMTGSDWRWSGNGSFNTTQVQSGVLRVDGSLTSPVNVQMGTTLQVGTGGASGTINGNIANAGAVVFNRGDVFAYNGVISGAGTVTQQGPGTLTLGGVNTYSGGTRINGGVLAVGADNALGNGAGALSFNGGTLRLNASFDVSASRAVTLDAQGGTLDTQGFTSKIAQAMTGAGAFTKAGAGTLVLTGANGYAGGTTIAAGTLQVGDGGTAGSIQGHVLNNGTLAIDRADAVALNGVISGTGSLSQLGAGTTTLSAANSYSGGTALKNGVIAVANGNALGSGALRMDDGTTLRFSSGGLTLANAIELTGSNDPVVDTGAFDATLNGGISGAADLSKMGTGTLMLAAANNTYSGATTVAEGTLRAVVANAFSAASAHTVATGATLDLSGNSQTIAALTNNGTVSMLGSAPGTTLTVNGPYVGNGGLLRMGTALGGSGSISDRLVLSGASAIASGTTLVQISNLGGLGASTTGDGIEIVSASNGATTTAQSTRNAFTLAGGHVDAGAFEYRLYAADAAGTGENWYLRTTRLVTAPTPAAPDAPATPLDDPSLGEAAPIASQPGLVEVTAYRAEVPLVAALPMQLRQSNIAMLGNLHQRVGDVDLGPPTDVPGFGQRRAWARVISTDIDVKQTGTVSPSTNGRLTGVQAGTDLYANGAWRAGLYAAQLDGSLDVRGFASGIADQAVGSNDVRNQYLGGYATYENATGFYADTVLQGGRHRYTVQPLQGAYASGKASSWLASVELGQAFAVSPHWKIEPQAQLVYQDLGMDDLALGGAVVKQSAPGSWLARLGVRAKGEIGTGAGMLQPYARLNFYRASGSDDMASFVGSADIHSNTDASWGELAAGMTLTLNSAVSFYGETGRLFSLGSDTKVRSDLQGSLGMRLRW